MAQKDIELILIRQWASYLAMPIWLTDAAGNLLYYNEPAESIVGRRYDEAGEMPVDELATLFETTDYEGTPMPSDELPITIALRERRPIHKRVRLRALDGPWKRLDVTAFPVEGQGGRQLGAVALFWERSEP